MQRIEEAKACGTEGLVTACGWCEANFKETLDEASEEFPVFELVDVPMRGPIF